MNSEPCRPTDIKDNISVSSLSTLSFRHSYNTEVGGIGRRKLQFNNPYKYSRRYKNSVRKKKREIKDRLKEFEDEVKSYKDKMESKEENKLKYTTEEASDSKKVNNNIREEEDSKIGKLEQENNPRPRSAYGNLIDHLVESLYNIEQYVPDNVKKKPNISSTRFANRFQVAVNMLDDWYVMDDESGKYVDSSSFPQSGDEPYKSIQQSKDLQSLSAKTIDFTGVINDLKAVNSTSMNKRKRNKKKDILKFDTFTTEFDVLHSKNNFNLQPTNVFHPVSCPYEIKANFDKTDFCQHISSLLVEPKDKEEVKYKELFSVMDLYSSHALNEVLNWCSYEEQQLD